MTGIIIIVIALIAFGAWQAWLDAKGRSDE